MVVISSLIFGRPFAKRFALCYRSVVCLSCPVCNVRALWPNGWTDQDETWHAGRPRPCPLCVRWGSSFPVPKGGRSPPIFGPYLLQPNGCMDQDATWCGGRPQPRRLCVRWGPRSTLPKMRTEPSSPIFGPFLLWSNGCNTAACIKMPLGMEVGLSRGDFVLHGNPAP